MRTGALTLRAQPRPIQILLQLPGVHVPKRVDAPVPVALPAPSGVESVDAIRKKTVVSASTNSVAKYIFNLPLACMVWWSRYQVRSVVFLVFEDAQVRCLPHGAPPHRTRGGRT